MKVRRKSLWRSQNTKRARKFANMRAAKERKRLARAAAAEVMPPRAPSCPMPRTAKPLFVITVRCRDGESVRLKIRESVHGLMPSASLAGKKIAAIVANYRPA
jgi:hypothetical protein